MSISGWKNKLTKIEQNKAYYARKVRKSYQQYKHWIDRYRGGVPAGVFTTWAYFESNWKMNAPGDKRLGEIGFFQITKTLPERFGLPANLRFKPEANVFLGGIEAQTDAVKFSIWYPQIRLGTKDSWLISRLAFAVGIGGTNALLKRAKPLQYRNAYNSIVRLVNKTGGIQLGPYQSPGKVWFRVHLMNVQWQIGQMAIPGKAGMPQILPPPPGVSNYVIPKSIKSKMVQTVAVNSQRKPSGGGLLLGGLFLGGLLLASTKE